MIVEMESAHNTDMGSELPPLSVNTMSQVQLTEFIPQLVCLVTGRQQPYFGKSQFKPEWWPDNVAWSIPDSDSDNALAIQIQLQELKDVVRSCYKHLGQESLLAVDSVPDIPMPNILSTDKVTESYSSQETNMPDSGGGSHEGADEPIWICFLCAKQFPNQDDLMTHQDICETEVEEEKEIPPTKTVLPPQKPVLPPKKPVLPPQRRVLPPRKHFRPQRTLPSHIVIQPHQVQKSPRPVKLVCHRKPLFPPEPYVPPSKVDFIQALNLSDTPKEPLRSATPVTDIDSDCEIIDVTYDETAAKTPRTPKSLMSQLSRDIEHSGRKRHLSFSQVLDIPEEYSESDSESEAESGSNKPKFKIPFGTLLCGIDLTSPLGQRVKKHWKIDTNYSITSGEKIENLCSGPMKNDFVEKLRHRGETSYPIVFNKKNRKHMARHRHVYKFTSSQRKEFMMRLKTGLSKRSRKLLKEIVKCNVTLERLKPGVIKRWMRRKPPPPYPYAYIRRMFEQEHPIIRKIVQKPIQGPKYAKLKQISDGLRRLNRPHNLLPNQRMVTKVVQNLDGSTSMKMVMANNSSTKPQISNPGNNRRKQNFHPSNVRQGDIEIIELSSSDEEGEKPKQQSHQTGQPQPRPMTHYKNITGLTQPSQQSQRPFQNSQRFSSPQPQTSTPKLNYHPRPEVSRSASPSNTRARIFQGVRGILSPSSVQNQPGVAVHSSPPAGSTCKEIMHNSKSVTGLVNRAIFKDSTPQILRTSQNSPQKGKTTVKASTFPGYIPIKTTVASSPNEMLYTTHITDRNGSLVLVNPPLKTEPKNRRILKAVSPIPPVIQSKPRDPIMESEVIVIDDD